ncbi:MAG: hypothetical protein ACE5KM_05510 [Planctomycetaceae bacterium]
MSSLAISSVGAPSTVQLSPVRDETQDLSAGEVAPSAPAPVDELLLSDVDADPPFGVTRTDVRLRSQRQLRVDDEGSIRLRSRSTLRYRYEFQSDDGTKIKIKARAKLKYSAQLDADGDVKIRTQAKFQVSLLKESVNSEAGSLSGAGDGGGLFARLSEDLAAFNDLVEQATSQFLSGEDLNGDALIVDLVGAFNGLIEALDPPPDETAPATDPPAVVASPPAAVDPPPKAPIGTPAPAAIKPAEDPPFGPAFSAAIADAGAPTPPANAPTATPAHLLGDESLGDADESTAGTAEPAALAEPVDFQSLRLRLRIQFTESLSRLVEVFDGVDDGSQTRLRYDFSANLKLSTRYRYDADDGSEPEIPALDASA